MKNFYFKKTIFGMVLMIENEYAADYPVLWYTKWERANEQESQEILSSICAYRVDSINFNRIKEEHPELII